MKEFRTALLAALGLFISLADAQSAEFRGLYVDAFHPGFKSHDQVTQMVNAAKSANFNALIVQVRKRGDAYYKSAIEPRAADIAADFDPLADIIAQAHAAGWRCMRGFRCMKSCKTLNGTARRPTMSTMLTKIG